MTAPFSEGEPIPQLSIGFPFDNPLGDIETEELISQRTLAALDFIVGMAPDYESLVYNPDGGRVGQNVIVLEDGYIIHKTETNSSHVIKERSLSFFIYNPSNHDESYQFVVALNRVYRAFYVDDYGVVDGTGLTDSMKIAVDAVLLNMEARLDTAPDVIPSPIDDGTLRADSRMAEILQALGKAFEDVATKLPIDLEGVAEPLRTVSLSEPFGQKLLQIIWPIIFARLSADDET